MSLDDFRPTVDEIGKRLFARTLTPTGRREGTFNDATTPDATVVAELIQDALTVVQSAVGEEIDNEYWPMAKTAVICHVCMSIEMGYYPETTEGGDSAYKAFKERFLQQIQFIEEALNQKRPNERRIVSIRMGTETRWGGGGRLDPWDNNLFP